MGYFPFFIDIKDKKILIIGGGNVALRKLEKLIQFEPEITVIAPDIREEFFRFDGIGIIQRSFSDNDLNDAFAVIGATDDENLNRHIFDICSAKNILVNIVDDPEKCGFIFPALVTAENITIGISTGGKSPVFARSLREQIDDLLDGRQLKIAEKLGRFRPIIKEKFDTEEKRKKVSEAVLELCLSEEKIPSDDEIFNMLERTAKEYENQDRNTKK